MPVTYNERTQRWVADYTDQYRKRHRRGFMTKREAKDHLVLREAAIRDRSFRPAAERTTLTDAAAKFLSFCGERERRNEIEPTTHHNYRTSVERYIFGTRTIRGGGADRMFHHPIGSIALGDFNTVDVEEFRGRLSDTGLSPSSVRSHLVVLSMVLAYAQRQGMVATNVAKGVRALKSRHSDDGDVVAPEKATVMSLVEGASLEHRLTIIFAALTGLRASEQRALQWKHVDSEQRCVRVVRRADISGRLGPPKTKAGRRSIPLPSSLLDLLEEQRRALRCSGPEDLVFPSRKGTIQFHGNMLERIWRPAWARVRERSAANGQAPPPYCNWHALRHFAISTWIEKNVPVKQVQKWAGHANAGITLDTYSHVFASADHSHVIDTIAEELGS